MKPRFQFRFQVGFPDGVQPIVGHDPLPGHPPGNRQDLADGHRAQRVCVAARNGDDGCGWTHRKTVATI
ncbi:MAG: hypothetical protein CMJ59_25350 [Planctomycetaceae bacterium]|nr:hypothetical protein [Planctomycetaceae bacterium]